ncbi:MAG: Asp23/Gls24 family envelope stress response protein [Selenomonadaceae bacterium]|nr:Asp23/Gls24 family envelope stress response protein [Selenomonadaceae bacterium]
MDDKKEKVIVAKKDTTLGAVRVADEVVSIIAGLAATEVNGISGMSGGIAGGIAEILGRKNFAKGVKVEVGEREAAIDLYIIVKYGVRIPDVALAAQENVKRAIETMTGLSVVEVNVHVQGVGFPEEEPPVEEVRVR